MARNAPYAEIAFVVAATLFQGNLMVDLVAQGHMAAVHASEPAIHQHLASNLHPGVAAQALGRACFGVDQPDAVCVEVGEAWLKSLWSEFLGHQIYLSAGRTVRTQLDAVGAVGGSSRQLPLACRVKIAE